MRKVVLQTVIFLGLLVSGNCPDATAQYNLPQMPQAPQPATVPRYDGGTPYGSGQVKMGGTAHDIQRQVNRGMGGHPGYPPGSDIQKINEVNEEWIHSQLQNDPAFNPALRNRLIRQEMMQMNESLFDDLDAMASRKQFAIQRNQANDKQGMDAYNGALKELTDMLDGKRKLSLAEAYFITENAFGTPYLTHAEYKSIVAQSVAFIKKWMAQEGLDKNDNGHLNYAIQKFMSETLTITEAKKAGQDNGTAYESTTHQPFLYDFNDFTGAKDHRNFFMTKCLATGTGQCNSLPAVYLALAEGLGAKANLSLAPSHSLIKYRDKSGYWQNYEPTSNWRITDNWYLDHMHISREAIANEIYLTPLSKKQTVADCILQLAFGYFRKYGGGDGKFITACVDAAKKQFPKDNNLLVYFTYSNLYAYELGNAMIKNRVGTLSEIGNNAETKAIYERWLRNETRIRELGWRDMPVESYEAMMQQGELKGNMQRQLGRSGKEKTNLFSKSQ